MCLSRELVAHIPVPFSYNSTQGSLTKCFTMIAVIAVADVAGRWSVCEAVQTLGVAICYSEAVNCHLDVGFVFSRTLS